MLFEINNQNKLSKVIPENSSSEVEIENYLISTENIESDKLLNSDIFKEDLLLIDNQTRTKDKKRADILALDKRGNLVVIELKKDNAKLGVEMQALQYLAAFSEFKGQAFIDKFKGKENELESKIKSFIENLDIKELNQKQRIILMAQNFDNSLLSMGEWLSSQGVAFRCLQYSQLKIGDKRYLSFSVYFDRSSETLYQLRFNGARRSDSSVLPQIYWHNIGYSSDDWWGHCVKDKFIAASFDNAPNDRGEILLKSYIQGDKIIAYANGKGAVGCGVIDNPNSYKLVKEHSNEDYLKGKLLHRVNINWEANVKLNNAISANDLKETYQIYPPIQTSSMIKSNENADRLIMAIKEKQKQDETND
jgi:hypothetical protein